MQDRANPLSGKPIVQVGIVVADIERSAQAWASLLGQAKPDIIITEPWEFARTEHRGRASTAQAKLAFFRLGPLVVELIEPIGDPSTWQEHLAAHGAGLHHIAFEVDTMAGQIASLESLGLSLVQRGEYRGGRYAYLDGTQTIGTIIELLENDPQPSQ